MGQSWKTEQLIICFTDDGQRVTVFRQQNLGDQDGPRKRYVLGNSQDVMVTEDLSMRTMRGDIHLKPSTRL